MYKELTKQMLKNLTDEVQVLKIMCEASVDTPYRDGGGGG